MLSDSEAEDEPASKVTLPQNLAGRGAKAGNKSAVRLVELGPRIRMQLLKIEEGLAEGEVLFHQYINKTEEEKKVIRQRREQRMYAYAPMFDLCSRRNDCVSCLKNK